jgi:hypothetical protein
VAEQDGSETPIGVRGLILIHELVSALGRQLDGTHVLFRFEPRCERVPFAARCDSLASEINRYADGAALHFAPFDGEFNVDAAGIPDDDAKFCADGFLEQLGNIVTGVAGAGSAAFRLRHRIANVMDGFVRRRHTSRLAIVTTEAKSSFTGFALIN